MTITLRPEHEELVAKVIQTGGYENADAVIGRALKILCEKNAALDAEKAEINERIERAYAQSNGASIARATS